MGKAIFCGKVKRGGKEHGALAAEDETENDAADDGVEGSGRACRQKGWWKRGVRVRVLFIGTQFSILYTSMYSPAETATPRA